MKRIGIILLTSTLCSCSASWHLRRAYKKDPHLFEDTTRIVDKVELGSLVFEKPNFNCGKKTIQWVKPREYDYRGVTVHDTVRVWYRPPLIDADSSKTNASLEVDCDPVVIKEQMPPVILEPTFWQKVKWVICGLIAAAVFLFFYLLFNSVRDKDSFKIN